jgi:glycosyltransferase involved in cell wall biosynthesis
VLPSTARRTHVLFIGDFSANTDEGFKSCSHQLSQALSKHADVDRVDGKRLSRALRAGFASRDVDVIHVIAQPTLFSLIGTRMFQLKHTGSRTVVSALCAERFFSTESWWSRLIASRLRPDLVLVQDHHSEHRFRSLGMSVAWLRNGVDLSKFRPASSQEREHIRRKYDLAPDARVVLHVGHLTKQRNLHVLRGLTDIADVILVASSYMHPDFAVERSLESAGIRVIRGYVPHVEELYQAADCFVFPVRPGNSLGMPLSVLEAMATNLPVITTNLAALVDAFPPGGGLTFFVSDDQVLPEVNAVLHRSETPRTREMVEGLSWDAIAGEAITLYGRLGIA